MNKIIVVIIFCCGTVVAKIFFIYNTVYNRAYVCCGFIYTKFFTKLLPMITFEKILWLLQRKVVRLNNAKEKNT